MEGGNQMRLTWRDAVTTLLVVFIGIVFYLWATGTELVVIGSVEGALLVIGLAGLLMWAVAGSIGDLGLNSFTALMVVFAIAAVVVFAIGMITSEPWTVALLAIDLAAMWLIDLLYRDLYLPTHQPMGV
jgi:hypothetical protein